MQRVIHSILLLIFAAGVAAAETPTAESLVDRAITAAGGADAFAEIGVLRISLDEQENLLDGTVESKKMKAFVDTSNVDNIRLEMSDTVILARSGRLGWAQINGQVDSRVQTPKMATGTINQKMFPLLLPFSLKMADVKLGAVEASTFDGTPSWKLAIDFKKGFFIAPTMSTTWYLQFARDDGRLLVAGFFPPEEFREFRDEGVRYVVLRYSELKSAKLPAEVLLDGVDKSGVPTGHTRITKLTSTIRGRREPTLFLHPEQVEAMEKDL